MSCFVIVLAVFWGVFWAGCLQFTRWGRFLAIKRTWITVVVGVGGDLLVLLLVLPLGLWLVVCEVVAGSAIGIVGRSLYNEWREAQAEVEVLCARGDGDGQGGE